jgi:hypothetical protein
VNRRQQKAPDETRGNGGLAEFDNSELLDVCEWTPLSGLLDWHFRRSWHVHVHLEFGDRFPVGKVAVRDLFVLVYFSIQTFAIIFTRTGAPIISIQMIGVLLCLAGVSSRS